MEIIENENFESLLKEVRNKIIYKKLTDHSLIKEVLKEKFKKICGGDEEENENEKVKFFNLKEVVGLVDDKCIINFKGDVSKLLICATLYFYSYNQMYKHLLLVKDTNIIYYKFDYDILFKTSEILKKYLKTKNKLESFFVYEGDDYCVTNKLGEEDNSNSPTEECTKKYIYNKILKDHLIGADSYVDKKLKDTLDEFNSKYSKDALEIKYKKYDDKFYKISMELKEHKIEFDYIG